MQVVRLTIFLLCLASLTGIGFAWFLTHDNKGARNRFSLQLAYSVPDTFVSPIATPATHVAYEAPYRGLVSLWETVDPTQMQAVVD
jgi:hypothetical protein